MRVMSGGQLGTGYREGNFTGRSTKDSGFISRIAMAMVIARLTFSLKLPVSSSSLNVNLPTPAGHGNNLGGFINQ